MNDSERRPPRTAEARRETRETRVTVRVGLDGDRDGRDPAADPPVIGTGLPFLDHLLTGLALHGDLSLEVSAQGDLEVDDHHTVEDTALVLGTALSRALGERAGIRRFGSAYAPLDEALARAVIDISGRPFAAVDLGLRRERIGSVSCENLSHFFRSLASAAGLTLHLSVLAGDNDHHRAEAAFKAFGLALREAAAIDGGRPAERIPSTKGVLE